jgi:hypothetical protein
MATIKLDNNNVSLAGEFAVLAQLALRGYVANMTLGRAKGIDILLANPDTGRMLKLEVKTTQKPIAHGWLMNEKHERLNDADLFFCFVSINGNSSFRFFIVPSAVVADYITRSHAHWADQKATRKRATPMRIFNLCEEDFVCPNCGKPNGKCPVPTPKQAQYENNWQFG